MTEIAKTQTVVVIENPGEDAKVNFKHDVPVPQPKENEVLVKMECCGLWSAAL
jgi:propanol-preferring alcohol dehydrogenase